MRRNTNTLINQRVDFCPNLILELADLSISLESGLDWCCGGRTLHRSLHHTYNEAEDILQPFRCSNIEDSRTLDDAILSDVYEGKSEAIAVKSLRHRVDFVRPLPILPQNCQIGY